MSRQIVHESFDLEDSWPQRLLHIPTMTSQPWQPGNTYGETKTPKYNVLSYTWGRWEDKTGLSGAEPLKIEGISWKIPAIYPDHFTTLQFQAALQAAVQDHDVDHVWLDVACINQKEHSLEMATEIGRQALIFGRAKKCYVWLNRQDTKQLQDTSTRLKRLEDAQNLDEFSFNDAVDVLECLTVNPWFTSLWTLQEAHVVSDAIFISKYAESVTYGGLESERFSLLDVLRTCSAVLRKFDVNQRVQRATDTTGAHRFKSLVYKSGFIALYNAINPMGLLSASNFREVGPERVNDRVYGIMQVFGFQLGISNPAAPAGKSFTLQELESEMGVALIKEYPLVSQMHVFDTPPPKGTAWHISRYSFVIRNLDAITYRALINRNRETRTHLNSRSYNGQLLGFFTGVTIAFQKLFQACQRVGPRKKSFLSTKTFGKRRQILALDKSLILEQYGFPPQHFDRTRYVSHQDAHIGDCEKLLEAFAHRELTVLLMGRETSPEHKKWLFGILLLKESDDSQWARIGIFIWFADAPVQGQVDALDQAILTGQSSGWVLREGFFG